MKMLNWAARFGIFCFLDNQLYQNKPHQYECLLAAGARKSITGGHGDLKKLDAFTSEKSWCFGHLSFELLHPLYGIENNKKDRIGFPPFYFFQPQHLLYICDGKLCIEAENPENIFNEITAWPFEKVDDKNRLIEIQPELTKEAYIKIIQQLQQHILRGDCYEINFCTAFHAVDASMHPVQLFQNLMRLSPAPFAALYRVEDQYLISASPERFLSKQKNKLITQPIKGTARRGQTNAEDEALKQALQNSAKEQAENVMIVDLMRNDLSKICLRGSVRVEELFSIYSFPQVHQMISTISGQIHHRIPFSEILQALFPMGSMTGAPKKSVLQLIHQYETVARGLFSGSVGYTTPEGDFDFNVVIRSLLYNHSKKIVQFQVGSGITFYSDAGKEWEECMVKAAALQQVLSMM